MIEKKIMPVVGCLEKRIYTEKYLKKIKTQDPCLMCEYHVYCYKAEVNFKKERYLNGKN